MKDFLEHCREKFNDMYNKYMKNDCTFFQNVFQKRI